MAAGGLIVTIVLANRQRKADRQQLLDERALAATNPEHEREASVAETMRMFRIQTLLKVAELYGDSEFLPSEPQRNKANAQMRAHLLALPDDFAVLLRRRLDMPISASADEKAVALEANLGVPKDRLPGQNEIFMELEGDLDRLVERRVG